LSYRAGCLSVIDPEDVANGNTTVTGLYADTGYKFRIKAVNKYGVGVAGLESSEYLLCSSPAGHFILCVYSYIPFYCIVNRCTDL